MSNEARRYAFSVREVTERDPDGWGFVVMGRVERWIADLGGHVGRQAGLLLDRHGYRVGPGRGGPVGNVLGHPLFELPIWLAEADCGDDVDENALLDVCESSLCGYLSVRAEDDYFDGAWEDPGAAMVLSGVFRARHQALLAPWISDRAFWGRFEQLWSDYGEAMLLERSLHHPSATYRREEFDQVLRRSQPLEIPGDAVLAMRGLWDRVDRFAVLVRHVNTATQLFDDFVDAPADLEDGSITWMVRRLGGLDGSRALQRGMITGWDEVVGEVERELESATRIGEGLGLDAMARWVQARRNLVDDATRKMYRMLFGAAGNSDGAGVAR